MGCVSSVTPSYSGGEVCSLQSAHCVVSHLHTLPSHAERWLLEPSNAPVFKYISFLFSPEINLFCHFTAGYAVRLFFFSVSFFFFWPAILCKCWCVAELSQEQIGEIIVFDGLFTSCNFQWLALTSKLAKKTALNHRNPLIFECVVGLSVTSPSDLILKVPLLPPQFGGSLHIAATSNL